MKKGEASLIGGCLSGGGEMNPEEVEAKKMEEEAAMKAATSGDSGGIKKVR